MGSFFTVKRDLSTINKYYFDTNSHKNYKKFDWGGGDGGGDGEEVMKV